MSVWDRYEGVTLDGQISIFDLQKVQELDKKYDIPRDYQKKEGWTDDWHYTEIETPKEHGIYFCITELKGGHYNYTYMAWFHGYWWAYARFGTKWLIVNGERRRPFAWVTVPDLYFRTDKHYWFLRENFVTEKDWESTLSNIGRREQNVIDGRIRGN